MSTEENKVLLRRLFEEVWNQGNLAAVDELLAADYVLHDPAMLIRGPEGFKAYVSAFRAAFPDIHATIEDQIAEEDKVAMRAHFEAAYAFDPMQSEPLKGLFDLAGDGVGIEEAVGELSVADPVLTGLSPAGHREVVQGD